jgi:uncharacterized membrane protein
MARTTQSSDQASNRENRAEERAARAEHRWPAVLALLIALTLYVLLPNSILPLWLRLTVLGFGLALLVPVLVLNPHRMRRQTAWSRWLSVGQALMLVAVNQYAIVHLIIQLVTAKESNGPSLLIAAVQVWVANVIAFALVYWELDRGGPVSRRHDKRTELPYADFRFPQDEDADAIAEVAARSSEKMDWAPSFLDYLYFSGTNSMAFSPTDTMPLSHRAKALMLAESFGGFVMLALVIAHAVGQLGG